MTAVLGDNADAVMAVCRRLFILVFAAGCASGVDVREQEIDALMQDYARPETPGASVLVWHNGRTVFQKGYGSADLERRTPASPQTHYRLASVTKQFTAAAILRLAQDHKLSLGDSIRRYLPALPSYADAITVEHLLTHTSGVVDYEDLIPAGTTTQVSDAGVLKLLESQSAASFPPGTSYHYSNSGYALLALMVERISGESFAAFLRRQIFLPNGMATTVAHEEGTSSIPDRAYGYSRNGTGWQRTDQSVTSAVLGDGGVYTSVEELSRWIEALDRGAFAEAVVPRIATNAAGEHYGYGWRISEHRGRTMVSHTGETIGFRNALVRFPRERLAVVVLTNRNQGTPHQIALAIAGRFLR